MSILHRIESKIIGRITVKANEGKFFKTLPLLFFFIHSGNYAKYIVKIFFHNLAKLLKSIHRNPSNDPSSRQITNIE